MRGKNIKLALVITVTFCSVILSACGKMNEPVILTVWHVYGNQTDSPMNAMVDEFNQTIGKEKGITVQVNQISTTNSIHEAVLAGANNEPGAAQLPDLFISYPKTVLAMPDQSVLVDFKNYFTEEELNKYISEFVDEGMIQDKLLILPIAKSTEVFFVNKTLFERFANDNDDVSIDMLNTWDGLFDVSVKYNKWTDAQTPDIPNDGKNFFVHDYHFNYLQIGVETLGEKFFDGEKINFSDTFTKVWMPYAKAAIQGGIWLHDGYATEPLRTGDAISSVASSASVLYYDDYVTYSNNISEEVEVVARPIPYFTDDSKMVMLRGAGFCLTKSTKSREQAAVTFLKWLNEPKNNTHFTMEAGYLPVTGEGFEILLDSLETVENPKYKSLYSACDTMWKDYKFYTAPQKSNYLQLESQTETNARLLLKSAHEEYINELSHWENTASDEATQKADILASQLAQSCLEKLKESFNE